MYDGYRKKNGPKSPVATRNEALLGQAAEARSARGMGVAKREHAAVTLKTLRGARNDNRRMAYLFRAEPERQSESTRSYMESRAKIHDRKAEKATARLAKVRDALKAKSRLPRFGRINDAPGQGRLNLT